MRPPSRVTRSAVDAHPATGSGSEAGPRWPVTRPQYQGKKPIPPRIHFEDGYQWLSDPAEVMRGTASAGHTREFWHDDDLLDQASPEAAARFHLDSCRFPPESHCLVWRQDEWRQLSANERSQMLGIPPSATGSVSGRPAQTTHVRNSLLLMAMFPQLCDARLCVPEGPPQLLHIIRFGSLIVLLPSRYYVCSAGYGPHALPVANMLRASGDLGGVRTQTHSV